MHEEMKEQLLPRETVLRDLSPEPIVCEAQGDYTLPDYQPEIRKILHVRATALPAGRYMSAARAEFAGTVSHTILYADAEGKLAAVTLDADYEFNTPLPEEGDYIAVSDSMAESTSCRLAGPRKLTLRTKVRSLVHLYREEDITPAIRGMGSERDLTSLEIQSEKAESMTQTCGSSGPFTLSGSARLDEPGAGLEAVWAGGNLLVSECRMQEGGCLCRGHAWVRCLLRRGDEPPYAVREKLPFEQLVPLAGAGERDACIGYGRLLAAEVELLPGEGEENGSLSFTVSAEVDACATGTKACRPVGDLYSTDYEMTCAYRPLQLTRPWGAVMGSYTISGSRARSECEAENAATVVDTDGRLEIHSVSVERGRAVVCGKLLSTVVFTTAEEGSAPLLAAEVPTPFRIETELRPAPGSTPRFDCHGELIAARARIEPGVLSVDAEIALCLSAYEDSERRILAEAEPDRSLPVEHRGNRIFVVYPREEDTLFSLASRYHKPRAAIAAQNGLGEGVLAVSHLPASLDGVHHLLIED